MLFANGMMVLCWLAGSFITGAARWAFWVFGSVFAAGVLIPLIGILPTAAARKGRGSRRLYGRLMCITMLSGLVAPWVWLMVEGAHALPPGASLLPPQAHWSIAACAPVYAWRQSRTTAVHTRV